MKSKATVRVRQAGFIAGFALFAILGPSNAAQFESPGTTKVSEALGAESIKGSNYEVQNPVSSDGYSFTFTINSPVGTFSAQGETQLAIRIQEIAAITELRKVTSTEAFAKAAGGAVLKPITSTANLVQNPEETVKGIPGGVKRKFENIGRMVKRGTKKVTEDEAIDPQPEGAQTQTQEQESTGAVVTKSVLGVTAAHRKWAEKVGADPYSTNPVLQEELDRLAKFDAAGRLSSNTVRPKIPGVETAARINNLVWSKDPYELQKINEKQLKEMAIEPDLAAKFLAHKAYSVTYQTQIVSSLHALGTVPGRSSFLRAAISAGDTVDALFYCTSAAILEKVHAKNPISGFVAHPRVALAKSGTKLIAVLPADRLFWTSSFVAALDKFAKEYQGELKNASGKQLWLSGDVSAQTKAELQKRGWIVHENTMPL